MVGSGLLNIVAFLGICESSFGFCAFRYQINGELYGFNSAACGLRSSLAANIEEI